MNTERACLDRLYAGFRDRDYSAVRSCYHPDVHFVDEVFDLRGAAVPGMWHMLLDRGTDLTFTVNLTQAPQRTRREPVYTFSATGRPVHNVIDSTFEFEGGQILRQQDQFNFHRWAGMALGPMGTLLGWTPWLRAKVSRGANEKLRAFLDSHPDYAAGIDTASSVAPD